MLLSLILFYFFHPCYIDVSSKFILVDDFCEIIVPYSEKNTYYYNRNNYIY